MDGERAIRPKSRATVVVVFASTPARESTPTDTSVIAASVSSGSISEIVPMNVVLPTPSPPLTATFTARGAPPRAASERPDMVPDPFQQVELELLGLMADQQPADHEIGDEHLGHAQRHP